MRKISVIGKVLGITLFGLGCLIAFNDSPIQAQDFEKPPVFEASRILPPELLKGKFHQVEEKVQNDGYMNFYTITSNFGKFEAEGNSMLRVRVQEIGALAELAQLSKTDVFLDAVKNSAKGQVDAVVNVAKNPVETVKGLPGGVKNMFNKTAKKAEQTVDAAQGDKYAKVSDGERRWAQKLGTDPYTSNKTLADAIGKVALVDSVGGFSVKLVPIPGLNYVSAISTVNNLAWSKSSGELQDLNQKTLTGMGLDQNAIQKFLDHPSFSPLHKTVIVTSLSEMSGVSDLSVVLQQALTADTETEVRFFVHDVAGLAWYHKTKSPLAKMLAGTKLPCALTQDGRQVSVLATDTFFWTKDAAEAAKDYAAAYADVQSTQRELWFIGSVSDRSKEELSKLGWTVYDNVAEQIGGAQK